jgi:23S rRNA (uracil1939-C5)-methyltransferase
MSRWRHRELAVWGGLPGESVEVAIDGRGGQRAHGRAVRILAPSPDRTAPMCAHHGVCGGCTWQHWELAAQRAWKLERVRAALEPLASAPEWLGALRASAADRAFRSKFQPMLANVRGQGLSWALYRPFSHDFVPIRECVVQDRVSHDVGFALLDVLKRVGASPDWLRGALVRSNGEQALVALLVGLERAPAAAALADLGHQVLAAGAAGVEVAYSSLAHNALLGGGGAHLAGRPHLEFRIGDISLLASATSFVQIHLEAAALLVGAARDLCPRPAGRLVDLFAGVGLFAKALRGVADEVVAVEVYSPAASLARLNLADCGSAEVVAEASLAYALAAPPADVVVLDPPRAGCGEALISALGERLRPRTVLYVSCHLDALARDAVGLAGQGFELKQAIPVDLFPHTPHVEVVCRFDRHDA